MKTFQSSISATLILLGMSWSLPFIVAAATDKEGKLIIGWIETVHILPESLSLSAKIDTGADNSSLNITDPLEFFKGEQAWIRFSILLEKDGVVTLEKPIVRFAHIKRKGAPRQKRAVVLFNLCLGTIYKKDVQVNLANRTGFKYNMLVGRSFLRGLAFVDAEKTYTQGLNCLSN